MNNNRCAHAIRVVRERGVCDGFVRSALRAKQQRVVLTRAGADDDDDDDDFEQEVDLDDIAKAIEELSRENEKLRMSLE